jgi:hypothetical protein
MQILAAAVWLVVSTLHSEASGKIFDQVDHIRFACSFTKRPGTAVAINQERLCELARKSLQDLAAGRLALDEETIRRERPEWQNVNDPKALERCRAKINEPNVGPVECDPWNYRLEYKDTLLPISRIRADEARVADKTSITAVLSAETAGPTNPTLLRILIHVIEPPGSFEDFRDSVEIKPQEESAQLIAEFQLEWSRYFFPRDFNALMPRHEPRKTP